MMTPKELFERRKRRTRASIAKKAGGRTLRLSVFRSGKNIYAQVIDDVQGRTLASASTMEADLRALEADKSDKARKVGALIAERAKAAGVEQVVFDRAGNKYHGRIAALADAAREAGLGF